MTQWYKAVNIDKNEYLWPLSFNSGDNLMESCYVGNDFVNAVTALLSGPWHGDQVMYIGDYAWDDGVLEDCSCSGAALLRGLKESGVLDADPYAAAKSWHDAAEYCAVPETIEYVLRGGHGVSEVWEPVTVPAHEGEIDCEEKRYVVNETQGVFYDRDKLETRQGCHLTQDPLLIFLAVGNGLGGGDYRSADARKQVGSWACQTISASNERPEGLREIVNPFDPNA